MINTCMKKIEGEPMAQTNWLYYLGGVVLFGIRWFGGLTSALPFPFGILAVVGCILPAAGILAVGGCILAAAGILAVGGCILAADGSS